MRELLHSAYRMPEPAAPISEKTVLAAFITFGVLAIVLGAMGLHRAIVQPIAGVRSPSDAHVDPTPDDLQAQQRAALAALDTDHDGLSDLDELERYHTSPFLADSDSDGRSDREEMLAGTDPNCPTGATCGAQDRPESVMRSPDALVLPGAPSAPPTARGAPPPLTPAELRAAFVRQGVPQATLDRLTDDQLEAAYRSSYVGITPPSSSTASPVAGALAQAIGSATQPGGDITAVLRALPRSAPDVRKFLEQTGFPHEQLAKLDDPTLERMWVETVASLERELRATSAPAAKP